MVKALLFLKDNWQQIWSSIGNLWSAVARFIENTYNSYLFWLLPGGALIKALFFLRDNWKNDMERSPLPLADRHVGNHQGLRIKARLATPRRRPHQGDILPPRQVAADMGEHQPDVQQDRRPHLQTISRLNSAISSVGSAIGAIGSGIGSAISLIPGLPNRAALCGAAARPW